MANKRMLIKVTAANGDGSYLINPAKIILVCKAIDKEKGDAELAGCALLLEGGIVRHVAQTIDFFETLLAK